VCQIGGRHERFPEKAPAARTFRGEAARCATGWAKLDLVDQGNVRERCVPRASETSTCAHFDASLCVRQFKRWARSRRRRQLPQHSKHPLDFAGGVQFRLRCLIKQGKSARRTPCPRPSPRLASMRLASMPAGAKFSANVFYGRASAFDDGSGCTTMRAPNDGTVSEHRRYHPLGAPMQTPIRHLCARTIETDWAHEPWEPGCARLNEGAGRTRAHPFARSVSATGGRRHTSARH
jgi:hypothetical protein